MVSLALEQCTNVIKDEIATLVGEVLPGEIDCVGDMLEQFAGREENLRDALLLMKERQEEEPPVPSIAFDQEEELSIFSMEEGVSLDSPRSVAGLPLADDGGDILLNLPPPPFGPPPRVAHTFESFDIPDEESPKVRKKLPKPPLTPAPTLICIHNSLDVAVPNNVESRKDWKTERMTYHLSCSKCNRHLNFVGSTDKDLKNTMSEHFAGVVQLVKSKGKRKGKYEVREDEEYVRHFGRHCKPSFWKKVPSNKDIIEFCQEYTKVEVLATGASMRRLGMDKTAQSTRNLCLDDTACSSSIGSETV